MLVFYACISWFIDESEANGALYRFIWNGVILMVSLYFLMRIRSKISEGEQEQLESQLFYLQERFEEKKKGLIEERFKNLEERILKLEKK